MKRWLLVGLALLAILFLVACGGKQAEKTSPEGTQAPAQGTKEGDKSAQSPEMSGNELAMYKGSDREDILKRGAVKEGKLVVYAAMPIDQMSKVTAAFEKKYGIPVEMWRASAEDVSLKVIVEAQAKQYNVDVVEATVVELEKIAREKLLAKYWSPSMEDYPKALQADYWQAYRVNFIVPTYNTNLLKESDLPKTYEDLLEPKWKGQLGLESKSWDWMATLVKHWGEEKGLQYFEALAAQQPTNRKGKSLAAESVAAGEVALMLQTYSYKPEEMKKKGAPVDWFNLEPVIAAPNGVTVAQNAPHPNAALLFVEFMLSPEGQEIIRDLGMIPGNPKVTVDPPRMNKGFEFIVMNNEAVIDESAKWQELFEKLFLQKK